MEFVVKPNYCRKPNTTLAIDMFVLLTILVSSSYICLKRLFIEKHHFRFLFCFLNLFTDISVIKVWMFSRWPLGGTDLTSSSQRPFKLNVCIYSEGYSPLFCRNSLLNMTQCPVFVIVQWVTMLSFNRWGLIKQSREHINYISNICWEKVKYCHKFLKITLSCMCTKIALLVM